jgi:spermidine synthase
MSALGNHILVEFSGCQPEIMNDVSCIENAMVEAAETAGATVINSTFHHFSPYGVSGVVVIQESHLAIHTWPEYGYAAVDLFTCGDQVDPWVSFDFLKTAFKAKNYSAIEMKRGALGLLNRLDFDLSTIRSEAKERTNPEKYTRNVWFTDKDDDQGLSLRYTGDVLFDEQSDFQRVKVLDTYKYGRMLALDNMVMTTEKDEFHYHEMISHPAMFVHGSVKKALVIGGGDGGTIRELLKHESIESITMVEIDGVVIEACKKYLPEIASSFDHPKLDLKVSDGIEFVKKASENSYDLVIIDGSDPVGPAEGLFTKEFYENCHKLLNEKGILVAQGESPRFNEKSFVDLNSTLKTIFGASKIHTSLLYVPTYPTGMWSFQWGVKSGKSPFEIKERINEIEDFVIKHDLKYYNYHIHKSSFALPNFVQKMLRTNDV